MGQQSEVECLEAQPDWECKTEKVGDARRQNDDSALMKRKAQKGTVDYGMAQGSVEARNHSVRELLLARRNCYKDSYR